MLSYTQRSQIAKRFPLARKGLVMITLRKASGRGHADHGWLDTHHTFSFADYYDPAHMGFRTLRVINEDYIAGGAGFPTHGHRDMEIISYVIKGALAHNDTIGNSSVIRPGDVQYMCAGTGIRHSESNPLPDEKTHIYQIWILPDRSGHELRYEQKSFADETAKNKLTLVVSHDGRHGSIRINQNADLYIGKPGAGEKLEIHLAAKRFGWLQMVKGDLTVNGVDVHTSDGLAIEEEPVLKVEARTACEFLFFDLA